MPVLPSGKSIELVPKIREINYIDTPPAAGYFWIDSSQDLEDFSRLPGETENSRPLEQVRLPSSVEDFKKYVSIEVVDESGFHKKTEYTLDMFPPEGFLSPGDRKEWDGWIHSDPVGLYLEIKMEECFDQVEYLNHLEVWESGRSAHEKDASGLVKRFDLFLENEPPDEKRKRHERQNRRALKYIERLVSMEVENPNAQTTWVDLLLEQYEITQDWRQGEVVLGKRWKAYPEQLAFHIGYLKCLFEQKKYTEVEKDTWEAVKQNPQNIEYWQLLVNIFVYQQLNDEAQQIVSSALAINPDNQVLLGLKYQIENVTNRSENS